MDMASRKYTKKSFSNNKLFKIAGMLLGMGAGQYFISFPFRFVENLVMEYFANKLLCDWQGWQNMLNILTISILPSIGVCLVFYIGYLFGKHTNSKKTNSNYQNSRILVKKIRAKLCRLKITTNKLLCKYCHSPRIVKYGSYNNSQYWLCRDCKKKFTDNDAVIHGKLPSQCVTYALGAYYDGMSINAIRRNLKQQYNIEPSSSTIFNWLINILRNL